MVKGSNEAPIPEMPKGCGLQKMVLSYIGVADVNFRHRKLGQTYGEVPFIDICGRWTPSVMKPTKTNGWITLCRQCAMRWGFRW